MLNFNVGEPTEEEDFNFRMAFTFWDWVNNKWPDDLEKIGTLRVYLYDFLYDPSKDSVNTGQKDLSYSPCTSSYAKNLGEQYAKYYQPGNEQAMFCLDEG